MNPLQFVTRERMVRAQQLIRETKRSLLDAHSGKRRVCCFDRSGFYSKSLSAPKAAS
jgi:hypothetical protein